jgi:hypothetical protein
MKRHEKNWNALITEWADSGQQALSFCREKQISTASFYHWRNRLRPALSKRGKSIPAPNNADQKHEKLFVPIQIAHCSNPADKEVTLHYPNGCYLSLKSNFDPNVLARINQAMGV